jgi:hypothetical protein
LLLALESKEVRPQMDVSTRMSRPEYAGVLSRCSMNLETVMAAVEGGGEGIRRDDVGACEVGIV